MQDARWIGRVHQTHVNCWEGQLCLGHKKQNRVALSTAKAELLSNGSCYAQLLWMRASLLDFRINKFGQVPLLCDSESAMKIATNRFNTQDQSTLIFVISS
jgi:hypothetical protein